MKVDLCVLHIRSETERLRLTAWFRSLSDISIPTTVGKSIGMPMQRRSTPQAKRRLSWHYRATAGRIGEYRRGLTSHTRAARYSVSKVVGKRPKCKRVHSDSTRYVEYHDSDIFDGTTDRPAILFLTFPSILLLLLNETYVYMCIVQKLWHLREINVKRLTNDIHCTTRDGGISLFFVPFSSRNWHLHSDSVSVWAKSRRNR